MYVLHATYRCWPCYSNRQSKSIHISCMYLYLIILTYMFRLPVCLFCLALLLLLFPSFVLFLAVWSVASFFPKPSFGGNHSKWETLGCHYHVITMPLPCHYHANRHGEFSLALSCLPYSLSPSLSPFWPAREGKNTTTPVSFPSS